MHVLILGGGFSTRLYPLTVNFPKALLPIKGKELLSYTMDEIIASNIPYRGISFVSNHRYFPLFELYFKLRYPHLDICMVDDGILDAENRLGSIGDLLLALERCRIDDDLFVLSSDTLTSLSFARFVRFAIKHDSITNAVFDVKDEGIIANKLGCVKLVSDRIMEFVEKPPKPRSTITSIPFYYFPKHSLPLLREYASDGRSLDAPGSAIAWLAGKTTVCGYLLNHGYYYDVGTIDTYNKLNDGDTEI